MKCLQYSQFATGLRQSWTFCDLFWQLWNRSWFSPKSMSFFGFLMAFPIDRSHKKSPTIFWYCRTCLAFVAFCLRLSAEREGFEPPEPLSSTVFKTAAIDHSAISPNSTRESRTFFDSNKNLLILVNKFFTKKITYKFVF